MVINCLLLKDATSRKNRRSSRSGSTWRIKHVLDLCLQLLRGRGLCCIGLAPFCGLCKLFLFLARQKRMTSGERGGFVRLPWVTTREIHEFLGDGRRPLVGHVDRRRRPVFYKIHPRVQLTKGKKNKGEGPTKLDRRLGCPLFVARLGYPADGDLDEGIRPTYSREFFLDEMSIHKRRRLRSGRTGHGAAHRAPMWSFLAAYVKLMRRSPLSASRGPALRCSRTRERWDGGGMNFPRRRGMVRVRRRSRSRAEERCLGVLNSQGVACLLGAGAYSWWRCVDADRSLLMDAGQ